MRDLKKCLNRLKVILIKMGENPTKTSKKDFVWKGLRVSFWTVVVIWVGESVFLPYVDSPQKYWDGFMAIVSFLFLVSGIFTFVLSIIHLIRHKKKAFAIVALVISSILMLLFLVGLITGIVDSAVGNDELEKYVESSCIDYCAEYESAESYYYEYDDITDQVNCYCLDSNEETVSQKPIPLY